jgi:hypothetical protein
MSTLPEDIAASQRLEQACQALQLSASPDQQEKLLRYMAQMQRWNRTYNLTAIRDPEQMLIQHLFDSLSVVEPLAQSLQGRPAKIYDVGSGGGLPGVVLAIMQPDWDITCVDAVEKKTAFVQPPLLLNKSVEKTDTIDAIAFFVRVWNYRAAEGSNTYPPFHGGCLSAVLSAGRAVSAFCWLMFHVKHPFYRLAGGLFHVKQRSPGRCST